MKKMVIDNLNFMYLGCLLLFVANTKTREIILCFSISYLKLQNVAPITKVSRIVARQESCLKLFIGTNILTVLKAKAKKVKWGNNMTEKHFALFSRKGSQVIW